MFRIPEGLHVEFMRFHKGIKRAPSGFRSVIKVLGVVD